MALPHRLRLHRFRLAPRAVAIATMALLISSCTLLVDGVADEEDDAEPTGGSGAGGAAATGSPTSTGGSSTSSSASAGGAGPGPTCTDGRANGGEADVDCGGSCPPCSLGSRCVEDEDCASGRCRMERCVDCVTEAHCPASHYCSASGACEPQQPEDAPCSENRHCLGGECDEGTCDSD